jgi:hypothetical protein
MSLIAESLLPEGDLLQRKTLKVVDSFLGLDPTLYLASDTSGLSLVVLPVNKKLFHHLALLPLIADVALPSVSHDFCPQPVQNHLLWTLSKLLDGIH